MYERGLTLSEEKTLITHLKDGFDFLGQNTRKYKDKILTKPAKKNVQSFLDGIRKIILDNPTLKQEQLIGILNPKIRGWTNYHRHIVSKTTFSYVDFQIYKALWRWCRRRHSKKGKWWVSTRYFHRIGTRNWVYAAKNQKGELTRLIIAADTKIVRHTKIRRGANPYDSEWQTYFEEREGEIMFEGMSGRKALLERSTVKVVCSVLRGANLGDEGAYPVRYYSTDNQMEVTFIMKEIKFEEVKKHERYNSNPGFDRKDAEKAVEFVLKKIDENLSDFTFMFPDYGRNQRYAQIDNVLWTSSFWTGMLWLAYEITGNEKYRNIAEIHLESFKKRIDKRIKVDNHDLGFLYSLSCVAAYKLTGNNEAKDIAVRAADYLTTRYHEKAGIIQAWGDLNNPDERGRMIIDCNMNLPLLYWTSEVTGDKKYFDIAYNHVQQAANHIVREDASTFHTFYMDVETGMARLGKTWQGYRDDSCWSRGQAWGIYGFTLSYNYTGDSSLLDISKKVGNYFLNRLPKDVICYWDLFFTDGSEERDSSAAAIAACGFLETAKHLPLSDCCKRIYENAALKILKSLTEYYTSRDHTDSNAVLLHAVGSKPFNNNVDEPLIFGDYYYFEALVRILKDWNLYW